MSLKVWLPLNGDFTNIGISNTEIELADGNTFEDMYGKVSKNALKITVLQPVLPINSCMSGAKEISYAFWVKTNSVWTTNWLNGIGWVSTDGTTTANCRQEFYTNCTKIGTWYKGGSVSNKSFTPGVWTHVAGTYNYNTGEVRFYLNGILQGTATNLDTTHYCRGDFNIGDNGVDILENDVRIYDHCLSAAEVHEISQGLIAHYKLDYPLISNRNYFKTLINSNLLVRNCSYEYDRTTGTYTLTVTEISDAFQQIWNTDLVTNATDFIGKQVTISCKSITTTDSSSQPRLYLYYTPTTIASVRLYTGEKKITIPSGVTNIGLLLRCDQNRNSPVGTIATFSGIKMELSDEATEWSPAPEDLGIDTTIITDSSGYGHNGTITGTITTTTDTPRYLTATTFDGTAGCTINDTIFELDAIYPELTWTGWVRKNYTTTEERYIYNGVIGVSIDNNKIELDWRHVKEDGSNVGTVYWKSKAVIPDETWVHIAAVFNMGVVKIYINGEYSVLSNSSAETGPYIKGYLNQFIGCDTTDSKQWVGDISDMRLYATALSEEDIRALYDIRMKVDNSGKIHTYEFDETSNNNNKITTTGVLKDIIIEPYLTLSDGSHWKLMLYHYVDHGNNLFTSSDAEYCNKFGLYSRLKYINNYTYNNKYEFYVNQDGKEFRWTQTSQPTASTIDGLTVVTGYRDPVNGLAKGDQSYTYIGYNTWWGACGSWRNFTTGGRTGIPGFGPHDRGGVCEQYLALYVRVEKNNASLEDSSAKATLFIEA